MASEHKYSTISYALGYIEDYVDNNAQPLEEGEDDDQETLQYKLRENEHREEIRNMMSVLVRGLTRLSNENSRLLQKVAAAQFALGQ